MVFNCFIGESFQVNGAQEVNHKADGSRGPVGRGHEVWKATCSAPPGPMHLVGVGKGSRKGERAGERMRRLWFLKRSSCCRALGISSPFRVLYAKKQW